MKITLAAAAFAIFILPLAVPASAALRINRPARPMRKTACKPSPRLGKAFYLVPNFPTGTLDILMSTNSVVMT
jgi:hypothetical protein